MRRRVTQVAGGGLGNVLVLPLPFCFSVEMHLLVCPGRQRQDSRPVAAWRHRLSLYDRPLQQETLDGGLQVFLPCAGRWLPVCIGTGFWGVPWFSSQHQEYIVLAMPLGTISGRLVVVLSACMVVESKVHEAVHQRPVPYCKRVGVWGRYFQCFTRVSFVCSAECKPFCVD